MNVNKPNRTRSQSTGRDEVQRKQSGDQHTLPLDEPAMDPHRPRRLDRQDVHKTLPDGVKPNDSSSS